VHGLPRLGRRELRLHRVALFLALVQAGDDGGQPRAVAAEHI